MLDITISEMKIKTQDYCIIQWSSSIMEKTEMCSEYPIYSKIFDILYLLCVQVVILKYFMTS